MKPQFSHFAIFFLTLLLAILPFWLLGSEPSSTQNGINESVNVDLVDLYLSAVDKKGHYISDLRADELSVQENGVPQQINHFSNSSGQDPNMPEVYQSFYRRDRRIKTIFYSLRTLRPLR